jgi:ribosomal protein L18E
MENESILLKKIEEHFSSIISERVKTNNSNKFDKLIKELEKLNTGNNEHVKQAIAMLKRERDLRENVLCDYLTKALDENKLIEIVESLCDGGEQKDKS